MNARGDYIRSRLQEFIYRCNKLSVDYMIAMALLDKIDEFPDIYIEEIALHANTTPASVTRFCYKMGYDSFKSLKNDAEKQGSWEVMDRAQELYAQGNFDQAIDYFTQQEKIKRRAIFQSLDVNEIKKIAASINEKNEVVTMTATSALDAVNVFIEATLKHDVRVFKISRHVQRDMLQDIAGDGMPIILLSLTGTWIVENKELIKEITDNGNDFFLIGSNQSKKYAHLFTGFISMGEVYEILDSTYLSQQHVQSVFFAIAAHLK